MRASFIKKSGLKVKIVTLEMSEEKWELLKQAAAKNDRSIRNFCRCAALSAAQDILKEKTV